MTSLSADDTYLNHYGFSHDPFAARVPGFKFFPAQRKPVLGQLHHLARYSQLLLVVTGPEGSGKTLVRQALVASSNKQAVQSVVITPQGTADSHVVLQQIAQALNVQGADFDVIMAQIIQLALTGQEVYLLVDNAEQLTGAAVETLLRLAVGSPEGRPHVFLFGEDSLVGRLEALVEGEERFHIIALQPYEEDETREYLSLRLEGAGRALDCLSEEQIERIHEESGGWPGAINLAARDELIEAMQDSKTNRKVGRARLPLPMKHLLAVVAVLCVIAVGFMLRDGGNDSSAPSSTQLSLHNGAESTVAGAEEPGAPAADASIEFDSTASEGDDEQPVVRESLAAVGSSENENPEQSQESLPSSAATSSNPADQAPAASLESEAVTPVVAATDSQPQAKPQEPVQQTPPPAKPAPASAPAQSSSSAADWYAAQPGNNYLVQILGTQTESNAKALIKQHGDEYRYFTKQHKGKPLYVVTLGSFSSRSAAESASKALPAKLRSGKPWIRRFSSVQQEISR